MSERAPPEAPPNVAADAEAKAHFDRLAADLASRQKIRAPELEALSALSWWLAQFWRAARRTTAPDDPGFAAARRERDTAWREACRLFRVVGINPLARGSGETRGTAPQPGVPRESSSSPKRPERNGAANSLPPSSAGGYFERHGLGRHQTG